MRVGLLGFLFLTIGLASVLPQKPLNQPPPTRDISESLFVELEELARIVDISYCVGITGTGIQKPFQCASRCHEFPDFELVTTWSTGQMLSDSCGFITLSHGPSTPRIILAFRGTYSIANTITDLSTIPQDYVPYPDNEKDELDSKPTSICSNCTVHMGFMRSWKNTKSAILADVERLIKRYPNYQLTLVGHSLGGAVATLAALEFHAKGWNPKITTFGEPRIGNQRLAEYIDTSFSTNSHISGQFRRVTHISDPVPLLPLTEWGYRPHGGEIFISKQEVPPAAKDLHYCKGNVDPNCIAGSEESQIDSIGDLIAEGNTSTNGFIDWWKESKGRWSIPTRWKIWELFFAHRDYFWRLGLCVPWSDPSDWFNHVSESTFEPAEL